MMTNEPIREALTVLCGIDQTDYEVEILSYNNFLSEYEDKAGVTDNTGTYQTTDLSGNGFLLNYNTRYPNEPIYNGKFGLISSYVSDENGEFNEDENPSINVRWLKSTGIKSITFVLFSRDNLYKTETAEYTSEDGTYYYCDYEFQDAVATERLYLNRIVVGRAFYFTNREIVNCMLTLRGMSQNLDDLTLPISSIEFSAKNPLKAQEIYSLENPLSAFLENSSVWYTAGYVGDMSPIRKFYLSEAIELSDNDAVITVKAEDAVKFLDADHPGKYIPSSLGSALHNAYYEIQDILDKAGIDYAVHGDVPLFGSVSPKTVSSSIFIKSQNKRAVITQLCKYLKIKKNGNYQLNVQYIDAGIPSLYSVGAFSEIDVKDFADVKVMSELNIAKQIIPVRSPSVSLNLEDIETISDAGTYINTTSDPYKDFEITGTGNSIEMITPYKYKAVVVTEGTVKGHKINLEFGLTTDADGDRIMTIENTIGIEKRYDEYSGANIANYLSDTADLVGNAMLYNYVYPRRWSFTWRGDPSIQPGRIMHLDYEGTKAWEPIIKTDKITLEHSGGGLISKVEGYEIGGYGYNVD